MYPAAFQPAQVFTGSVIPAACWASSMRWALTGAASVSYTHLDVYKRQAVARALAHGPKLVIAAEPTGNIDPELSLEMMELLERVSETGITVVVVTHEHELVRQCHPVSYTHLDVYKRQVPRRTSSALHGQLQQKLFFKKVRLLYKKLTHPIYIKYT